MYSMGNCGNIYFIEHLFLQVTSQVAVCGGVIDLMERTMRITREEVKDFTWKACLANGFSADFFEDFWERLSERDDIYKEYVYYLVKKEFLGEVKIEGYQVVDVLVWQMDGFKSKMDRDNYDMKNNEAKMILSAFDTFLKMAKEPGEYVKRLQHDTGTDYEGKFFGSLK